MEARVKAGIWVSMALRLPDLAGRAAAVLRPRRGHLRSVG